MVTMIWLRHLENAIGSSKGTVLTKTALDYLCWAPTVNAANLFLVPILQGCGVDAAVVNMETGFISLMVLELAIFGPYNLLGFGLIAPNLRPTVKAVLSFAFSISLSIHC